MALTNCRECGAEVSSQAGSCPHCGIADPAGSKAAGGKQSATHTARAVLGCLGLVVLIILAGTLFQSSPSHGGAPDKVTIYTMAQQLVERQLRAPRTAKFPWSSDAYEVSNLGDNRYRVSSWVDSENAFGAMIRTYFVIEIRQQGDTWSLLSIQTRP